MREGTLLLFYIVKFTELVLLTALTIIFSFSGVSFAMGVPFGRAPHLVLLSSLAILLCSFNLLHNNLLTNLRYSFKLRSYTAGLFVYDFLNYPCCINPLRRVCRDQCFTSGTIIKWLVQGAILGYLTWAVRDFKETLHDEYQNGVVPAVAETDFDLLLILYLVQHPVFIVARLPIFIIYTILTCCCDKGQEYSDSEEFGNRIISFQYIEVMSTELDNHGNFVAGRQDFEEVRRLSVVQNARRATIEQQQSQVEMSQSMIMNIRNRAHQTILATLSLSMQGDCMICLRPYMGGERIATFACNEKHFMHEECWKEMQTSF